MGGQRGPGPSKRLFSQCFKSTEAVKEDDGNPNHTHYQLFFQRLNIFQGMKVPGNAGGEEADESTQKTAFP